MPLIHANGVEVHYHLQGTGTPIVFLHPPCIGSRVFTYIRNDLSQDHKTLLMDFRGHGRSSSSQAPITIPLLAEDVHQMLDMLGISKAYLCAYSVGTMVAMQAMLTYPDRFVGGILLGGVAEVSTWKTKAKLKAGLWAGKIKARELISLPLSWVHADNREAFHRIRGEIRIGDIRNWREYMESGLNFSITKRLKDIAQPVLLVCGERDSEFKGYMKVLQNGLPNDSSAFVPGLRHALPIYGAGMIGDLIRDWVSTQQLKGINDGDISFKSDVEKPFDVEEISIEDKDYEAVEPNYQ